MPTTHFDCSHAGDESGKQLKDIKVFERVACLVYILKTKKAIRGGQPLYYLKVSLTQFFYLHVIQFDRSISPEYLNHYVKLFLFLENFFYCAGEATERTVHYLH